MICCRAIVPFQYHSYSWMEGKHYLCAGIGAHDVHRLLLQSGGAIIHNSYVPLQTAPTVITTTQGPLQTGISPMSFGEKMLSFIILTTIMAFSDAIKMKPNKHMKSYSEKLTLYYLKDVNARTCFYGYTFHRPPKPASFISETETRYFLDSI